MSLRDGTKKMSKSEPSDQSRINLTDDADTIALKIRRAKTDPEPLPSEEKGLESRPEADNLVGIYAALAGMTKADVLRRVRRRAVLRPSRPRWSTWRSRSSRRSMPRCAGWSATRRISMRCLPTARRARRCIAAETMKAVKDIVGFVRR